MVFNNLEDIIAYYHGVSDGVSDQVSAILDAEIHSKVEYLLSEAMNWVKRRELLSTIDLTSNSTNRKKYLDPLIERGWIQMEFEHKLTHPNQKYRITESGKKLLKMVSSK